MNDIDLKLYLNVKRGTFFPINRIDRYFKDLNNRFETIKLKVTRYFLKSVARVEINNSNEKILIYNFDYQYQDKRYLAFLEWVTKMLNKEFLNVKDVKKDFKYWSRRYISEAYVEGVEFTDAEFNQMVDTLKEKVDIKKVSSKNPFLNPYHLIRARYLYSRHFEQLKGISQDMSKNMARVLGEGMVRGEGPLNVARKLRKTINLSKKRSKLIARTEMIYGYNLAKVEESYVLEKYTVGGKVKFKWLTVGDKKVREKHRGWNKKIMTRKQALSRIGEPNCRCSVVPVF